MTAPTSRVRNCPPSRLAWERLQYRLTSSGWPARLARRLGGRAHATVTAHAFEIEGPAAPPLRIAFASDFHAGPTTHPALLASACTELARQAPDVLLLGGDFVCLRAEYIDALAEQLGSIPAPLGRYAVLGNHDLWTDYVRIERRLEAAGVQLLTNRNVRLPSPFDHIWVCGLDDHGSGRPDATAAFDGADGARVVLMHAPSGLLDIGDARFDVAFSGHTHGGQIALPGGIPVVVPQGVLSRSYARGVYEVGQGRRLAVSLGIGCSTVPFRFNATPEVLVCTLTSRPRNDRR